MNNIGLVEHCKMALREKFGYVWSTFGQVLTETLLQQRINQYPSSVGGFQQYIRQNWMGRRVADCSGLIKSYLWWNNGNPKYNPTQDLNANMMYGRAKRKGVIATLPEIEGMGLWKNGHVGVYIGNRQVIEARSTRAGVIQSPLTGTNSAGWTHWMELPNIQYIEKKSEMTTEEAIAILHTRKVINSADYWHINAKEGKTVKGEYAAALIKNMALKLKEGL
jgi:hypothetical protein